MCSYLHCSQLDWHYFLPAQPHSTFQFVAVSFCISPWTAHSLCCTKRSYKDGSLPLYTHSFSLLSWLQIQRGFLQPGGTLRCVHIGKENSWIQGNPSDMKVSLYICTYRLPAIFFFSWGCFCKMKGRFVLQLQPSLLVFFTPLLQRSKTQNF